jgi:hypothetical protein
MWKKIRATIIRIRYQVPYEIACIYLFKKMVSSLVYNSAEYVMGQE